MNFLYVFMFIFIWASGPIFVKLGLSYTSPINFLVLRSFTATFCFFVIWFISRFKKDKSKSALHLQWKNILFMIITALLLQVAYQTSFFYALQYKLSPGLLMIILGTQPIFTAIVMSDKLTKYNWFGLFFALFGLYLVVSHSTTIHGLNFFGILFGLIALMGMTIGTIFQKRFCSNIDFSTNLFFQYLISSILFLMIDRFHIIHLISFNIMFFIALFWMGIIVSVVATCLYYYLINSKQLTRVTTIFYGVPIVTVILDYFIYHQAISIVTMSGFFMTCLGLYFSG